MAKLTKVQKFDIDVNTLELRVSNRGGGIRIDLKALGAKYKGGQMTAYQNYLGGDMLGRIGNDSNIRDWRSDKVLVEMAERLAKYFHSLTNHEDDEWEAASFEENQKRPLSAY